MMRTWLDILSTKLYQLDEKVPEPPQFTHQQHLLTTWTHQLYNKHPVDHNQNFSDPTPCNQDQHFSPIPFPQEIIAHILSYLPFTDTLRTSAINKQWYIASCNDYLWTLYLLNWIDGGDNDDDDDDDENAQFSDHDDDDDGDHAQTLENNQNFVRSIVNSNLGNATGEASQNRDDDENWDEEGGEMMMIRTRRGAKWKMISCYYRGRDHLIRQRQAYLSQTMTQNTNNQNHQNVHQHYAHVLQNAQNAQHSQTNFWTRLLLGNHLIVTTTNTNATNAGAHLRPHENNRLRNRARRRRRLQNGENGDGIDGKEDESSSQSETVLYFDPIRMCFITKRHLIGDLGTVALGVSSSVLYLLSTTFGMRPTKSFGIGRIVKTMLVGSIMSSVLRFVFWDAYYDERKRYKWRSGRFPHTLVTFVIGLACTFRSVEGFLEQQPVPAKETSKSE